MLRELGEALDAVAGLAPLALVLEDLQWSDLATVDALAWVARREGGAPPRLLGTVAAYEDAPDTRNLRWLLLSTKSYGKGTFGDIAYVQRVNTTGGMPPQRCEAGQLNQLLRVDFSADFVFYRAR